jgi:hypothetical protein
MQAGIQIIGKNGSKKTLDRANRDSRPPMHEALKDE